MSGTFSLPFVFISKRYHCHRLYYHLIIIIQIEFKDINTVSQDMSQRVGYASAPSRRGRTMMKILAL